MRFTKYELDYIEASRDRIESLEILNDAQYKCVELDEETSMEQRIAILLAHVSKEIKIHFLVEYIKEPFPSSGYEECNVYLKINNKVVVQGVFEKEPIEQLIKSFILYLTVEVKIPEEVAKDIMERAIKARR